MLNLAPTARLLRGIPRSTSSVANLGISPGFLQLRTSNPPPESPIRYSSPLLGGWPVDASDRLPRVARRSIFCYLILRVFHISNSEGYPARDGFVLSASH